MADDFGYHIDHHGSLVRPPALLAARASGMDAGALAAVTDEAVVTLAHELRRLTLNAMCDGQYRRSSFESVVHDQVAGSAPAGGPAPLSDLAGIAAARRRSVPDAAALAASGRLAQAEAAPVLATVDRSVFVTLPSAGYLAAAGSALSSAADLDAARAAGTALAAILGRARRRRHRHRHQRRVRAGRRPAADERRRTAREAPARRDGRPLLLGKRDLSGYWPSPWKARRCSARASIPKSAVRSRTTECAWLALFCVLSYSTSSR
jgi:hypothetical protein